MEPFSDEFTVAKLAVILKSKRTIRSVLLDQQLIVGIGNIYVSEILFGAGIYPGRLADSLTKHEISELYEKIITILSRAITLRGTTFSDYRDSEGKIGGFQNFLKVYNKEGKQCEKRGCTEIIQKEALNQRSSFWCAECQKSIKNY